MLGKDIVFQDQMQGQYHLQELIHSTNQSYTLTQTDPDNTDSNSNNFNLVGNPFSGYVRLGDLYNSNNTKLAQIFIFGK